VKPHDLASSSLPREGVVEEVVKTPRRLPASECSDLRCIRKTPLHVLEDGFVRLLAHVNDAEDDLVARITWRAG
jgi:hypothetical protein